jgi:quercetin dioxygenase-like cupin family protein
MSDQPDAVATAPEHHKVLLENDQIRVLETLLKPGEEMAAHTHVMGFCTSFLGAISCVTTSTATS